MKRAKTILVATSNPDKLGEVRAVLGELGVEFVTLGDFGDLPAAVEDGDTFAANAEAKARHYSRLTGCWTLADDSGLEVDALGGGPGVRSARYAGRDRDYAANNAKLVSALAGVPPERRAARFHCAMALAAGERILATSAGTIEGRIIDIQRGCHGFGFDPLFLVPELGMTTAEMPPEQKNRISHRGQALRAMAPVLAKLLTRADPADANRV
ncbi:MAG TPA: RdgB/HAM1 family non-canonical purine NTP pyrophosphatase [Phycisphaerae bacterium]|nr:RdgB/HAM1 family non-canonical purine NTP pyrophosphatase [Phycisphaerae bacterium]